MEKLKDLKKKIEYILKTYPDTRDSDTLLTFYVIWKFLPDSIVYIDKRSKLPCKDSSVNTETFISTYALKLVREDNIKRIRALFNAEGKYISADANVRKKRKQSEAVWIDFCNSN